MWRDRQNQWQLQQHASNGERSDVRAYSLNIKKSRGPEGKLGGTSAGVDGGKRKATWGIRSSIQAGSI